MSSRSSGFKVLNSLYRDPQSWLLSRYKFTRTDSTSTLNHRYAWYQGSREISDGPLAKEAPHITHRSLETAAQASRCGLLKGPLTARGESL